MKSTKKKIPKYDSKTVMGRVVFDPVANRKRVIMDHPAYYNHEVDQFAIGDAVAIKFTNRKQKRTLAQNNYLHLYLTLIAKSSGNSLKVIKSWVRQRFLAEGITEVFGEKVRYVGSTADLTVMEMMELVARIELVTGMPAPNPEPFNLAITHAEYQELKAAQQRKYMAMKPKLD